MRNAWRYTALTAALAAALTGCAQPADRVGGDPPATVPVVPTTTVPARPIVTTTQPPPPPVLTTQRLVRIANIDPLPGYLYRGDGFDSEAGPATLILEDRSRLELSANARIIDRCRLLVPVWATSENPCWAIAHIAEDGSHVLGLRLFAWVQRDNGLQPVLSGESTVRVVDGYVVLRDDTRLRLTDATQYSCPPAIVEGLKAGGATIPGGSLGFTVDDSLAVTLVECHLPL